VILKGFAVLRLRLLREPEDFLLRLRLRISSL